MPGVYAVNLLNMSQTFNLKVNKRNYQVSTEPDTPLLYVLRNDLTLNGPKFGCGLGQCSACMVMMEGEAIHSCNFPVSEAEEKEITTLEGLGTPDNLHPVQKAFIDEQAMQCGYCINGMIIASTALLIQNSRPDETTIKNTLAPVLCRCGAHDRIIKAVKRAAGAMSNR